MSSIRTLNLVWEKRVRGAYSVAPHALTDTGVLALALPRPLEVRTFDLTHLRPDGSADTVAGFSVETLLKLQLSPVAEDFIGMTSDDLYLFRSGTKSRFLGERHVVYVDTALSEDGQRVLAAFSDFSGSSYALALGDVSGAVTWTHEIDVPLTCVTLTRAGNRLAVGAENGTIFLFDASRRPVWEFGQEGGAIRTLAASADGVKIAYGTQTGSVGLIDGDGTRLWEASLPGEVYAVALAGDASVCAALVRIAGETPVTRLVCYNGGNGHADWEYDGDATYTGLALSPDGGYLAVSARGGHTALYAVVRSSVAIGDAPDSGDVAAHVETLTATGDLTGAYRALKAALDAAPADLDLFERWVQARAAWIADQHGQARAALEQNDYAHARALLQTVLDFEPLHTDTVQLLAQCGSAQGTFLLEQGRNARDAQQTDDAIQAFELAIEAAPFLRPARQELANVRAERAQSADVDAERLLADNDWEGALRLLEQAQAVAPTSERGRKLDSTRLALELAQGMQHYNAKEYPAAIFQFKKVLARDANHVEARRYLGFAQRFAQDTSSEALNDRFARLE